MTHAKNLCKFALVTLFLLASCKKKETEEGVIAPTPTPSTATCGAWTNPAQLGGVGSFVYPAGVITNSNCDSYVIGWTSGPFDGDAAIGSSDSFVMKYNSAGVRQWKKHIGVAMADIMVATLALDSLGNLYIAGSANSDLNGVTRISSGDAFLIKYDEAGTLLWTKFLAGLPGTSTVGTSLSIKDDIIYLVGQTNGNLNTAVTGLFDVFVAKYSTAGVKDWARQMGAPGDNSEPSGVVIDSSGNVIVVGSTEGIYDGNPAIGAIDATMVKFDATGTKLWSKQYGIALGSIRPNSVAIDSQDAIYLVGTTDKSLNGAVLTGTAGSYLSKFDAAGTSQWNRILDAGGMTQGSRVLVTAADQVVVAGSTDTAFSGNTLSGAQDLFISQFDSSGTRNWLTQLGATAGAFLNAYGIDEDPDTGIYLVGNMMGGTLDGNPMVGTGDIFLTKFTSSGVRQ